MPIDTLRKKYLLDFDAVRNIDTYPNTGDVEATLRPRSLDPERSLFYGGDRKVSEFWQTCRGVRLVSPAGGQGVIEGYWDQHGVMSEDSLDTDGESVEPAIDLDL